LVRVPQSAGYWVCPLLTQYFDFDNFINICWTTSWPTYLFQCFLAICSCPI